MARLFISYARADGTAFADQLQRDLQPHEVWLDRSEISGGAQWEAELEEAIDRCDAALAVLTRAYPASRVSRDELQRTRRRKKPIIPLLVHADAERQLLLESVQYIDFSNPATRQSSLRQLLDLIANPGEIPRPADAAPELTWQTIAADTGKQARRFVQDLEGTAKAPGTFIPDVYVRRETADAALRGLLDSEAAALIAVGGSGSGKTNMLCRLVVDLLDQGHAVLAYDCAALADDEVGEELVRDLPVARGTDPLEALENIDAEAARAGRKLVIVFDSIGDYRGDEGSGAQVLLRRINDLAKRAGTNVKFVLTCNTAAWGRLERLAPIRLDRRVYYRSPEDEPFLRVDIFTPAEAEAAYRRYQEFFDLFSKFEDLPPEARERLRDPVLLRMTAEAGRGDEKPLLAVDSALRVYGRFFDERVRLPRETWLIDKLAEQMLAAESSTLALSDLSGHKDIGQEILDEDPGSVYSRLLDSGVLQEAHGDQRTGPVVRFAHARVAAYALAKHLRKQPVAETAAALVAQNARFPLGWDVARTLLLLTRDGAAIATLAGSADVEQRELAAEALVELHAEDPKAARALLQSLLDDDNSEAARRTALKAAYNIGPQTRDFFLRAALDRNRSVRESVRNTLYLIWRNESPARRRSVTDTLYLIWRHSPGFTYELLTSLVDELGPTDIVGRASAFRFVIELIVTIYINHCEEEEVIQNTAALLHHLAVDRMHLNLLKTGVFGKKAEQLFLGVLASAFAAPVLDWMLFTDGRPATAFFKLPRDERAPLGRIADFYDPNSDLAAAYDDLASLLESKMPTYSGAAAVAIAVHAAKDFAGTEPLIRRLWDGATAQGRLWILMAFSVLLKTTPVEWVELLEDLTRRYVRDHRDAFLGSGSRLAGDLDLVFVPLGLAYGKRGAGMPLFESLVKEALAANDAAVVARCVTALGPVGFNYPHAALDVLEPVMNELEKSQVAEAMVRTLATIRVLHFDAVNQFLNRTVAPEGFRRRIDTVADVGLVHSYILVLGYFNNAVHFTLNYPRMRKTLSAGALKLLAETGSPREFLGAYTATAWRMLHASKFKVIEWTLPE